MKNQYKVGRFPKNGGLDSFADLRGGDLARNRGCWYPNAYYKQSNSVEHKIKNPKCMVIFFLLDPANCKHYDYW